MFKKFDLYIIYLKKVGLVIVSMQFYLFIIICTHHHTKKTINIKAVTKGWVQRDA